jgi:hypothetical protein
MSAGVMDRENEGPGMERPPVLFLRSPVML